MKTEESKLEVQQEQLDIPVVIHRIEELIKEYYTLEKEYKIYTDLSMPYRKEDFTICEPSNILYRKKAYEDVFYWLKLKIRLWSEYGV
jgi:hypothetical protein